MAQVRALYEDSAVPVREIAARAGVTERTLYKYACKGQWRPRYLRSNASACMLMRGWRAAEGFAPVTGAGGRFVRREDGGKPFAKGLKALDPAARAKAEAECAEAVRLSREAAQEAELARLRRERRRALTLVNRCMDDIIRDRKKHPAGRLDPEDERLLIQSWQYSVEALKGARLACEQFESRMKAASYATNPAAPT
jgi:AcrR family transcriptional regulator